MEKAVVLLSGGVDSSTVLGCAVDYYGKENVICVTFQYGQRHSIELESAKAICKHFEVEHIIRDLSDVYKTNTECKLLQGNEHPEHITYKEQTDINGNTPVDTYVPFRNGLMLSYLAAIAVERDCDVILYGAHAEDAEGNAYPDCSVAFNEYMGRAINEGTGGKVSLVDPLIEYHKKDVVKLGLALQVPYQLTYSCYEGNKKPCGVCGSCRTRIQAFIENGVTDPVDYEDSTYNILK